MTNSEKSRSLWVRGRLILACPVPTPRALSPQPVSLGSGPNRKLHKGVQLLSGELGVGEALQVYDESLRQCPQVQLLGGQLVLFAVGAVPADRVRVSTDTFCACSLALMGPVQARGADLISSLLISLECSSRVIQGSPITCPIYASLLVCICVRALAPGFLSLSLAHEAFPDCTAQSFGTTLYFCPLAAPWRCSPL